MNRFIRRACRVLMLLACCVAPARSETVEEFRDLLSPAELPNWRLTAFRRNAEPWTLSDGVFGGTGRIRPGKNQPECYGTWVGHAEIFEDFVLEAEFLFDGSGQGGIVLRGDREAPETWKAGYELDIDWSADRKRGHVHFPVKPSPYTHKDLLFEVGKWHALRVEARDSRITVTLDGKETIAIEDGEFPRGQLCLEDGPCQVSGHRGSHVKYRSLRVRKL